MTELRPAALAFDAVAPSFDNRFGEWQSVAAQRDQVRRALLGVFPKGGHILEIGGGTGDDAAWLAQRGFKLVLTDPSPTMVVLANRKLKPLRARAEIAAAEDLEAFADRHLAAGNARFDGVFSNFAPLNCVDDLTPVARGLARLVKPGGAVMLVLFGVASPGDILVETLRGRTHQAFRRFRRDAVPARLGGRHFTVRYHRARAICTAMGPWFKPVRRTGIGVFVPPSAAEPWISRHPRFLRVLEALDRLASRPLASLGDHILYHFQRTDTP
jgi:ubiquinone/menaquinone biosynthesis C-methylase UbiE